MEIVSLSILKIIIAILMATITGLGIAIGFDIWSKLKNRWWGKKVVNENI